MAGWKDSIEKTLCHLFPSRWLNAQAKETGLVKRQRKIHPVALFWTLVLGFGLGKHRDIASLRRAYEEATGTQIAPSSFYDRFTPALVAFLKQACQRALEQVTFKRETFKGMLSAFSDILIADATILRLHDFLQGRYPACRTNHTQAAAKLHLVFSVLGQSEQKVKLTGERKKESQVWTIGAWVRNRLLLFDLGFFKYALLDRIDTWGGFFISRLKGLCNPTILSVHQGFQGRLPGCKLKDALSFIRREILDVEVEVSYKKRKYKGKRRTVRRSFRVVGIKNATTQTYHLYITNIPAYILPAQAIAHIYTARWLIELVFKKLKSFYGLEGFPSTNLHIVHTLIYTALILMLLSQNIQQLLVDRSSQEQTPRGSEDVFPLLRLAAVLRTYCKKLLELVLRQAGIKPSPFSLTELIRKEARDPNRRRPTLPQRLQCLSA